MFTTVHGQQMQNKGVDTQKFLGDSWPYMFEQKMKFALGSISLLSHQKSLKKCSKGDEFFKVCQYI